MMRIIKSILFCFILISFGGAIFANNLSQYQYHAKINVDCDEYIGQVIFDLPQEYDSLKHPKSYFDVDDFYIIKKHDVESYKKLNNWYSEPIVGIDSVEIEKLSDNDYNSYLLVDSGNHIEIEMSNPNILKVDKLQVDVKDTVIDNIELYTKNGEKINFQLDQKLFTYNLILDKSINVNDLILQIGYQNLLKIKEISLYEKLITPQNSRMYFSVNNNCDKTFNLYFGDYGKDYAHYRGGEPVIQKSFNVNVENNPNSLYVDDFDSDGIKNDVDNCLELSNSDQKDINYNNIGDACEDFDSDSILNKFDNCVDDYNRDQLDDDNDGIGNVCDDGDNRFFESNKVIVYIIVVIVCLLFVVLSINLFKKK